MSHEQLPTAPVAGPPLDTPAPRGADRLNPERWPEEHGDALFSFVMARVRSHSVAQDVVQETFLAALKARGSFAGRSSERAWLFGILRNKLADYYRLQSRETPWADPEFSGAVDEGLFHGSGPGKDGWISKLAPKRWAAPDESLVGKEFEGVFNQCLSGLPERVAHVFLLREVDETPSDIICKELGISSTNLWVMLHRARMALRRCLEAHWFGHKPAGGGKPITPANHAHPLC
jgi:RNA polymerase sigma-70 factor (TIGR02943 family)